MSKVEKNKKLHISLSIFILGMATNVENKMNKEICNFLFFSTLDMKYNSDKYSNMCILIVEKEFLFCETTMKKFDRNENVINASFIGNTGDSSISLTHSSIQPYYTLWIYKILLFDLSADLISNKFCFDGILTCA